MQRRAQKVLARKRSVTRKKSVRKKSVRKKPIRKKPARKKPIRKKPVRKKPIRKKPVRKKPVRKKTAKAKAHAKAVSSAVSQARAKRRKAKRRKPVKRKPRIRKEPSKKTFRLEGRKSKTTVRDWKRRIQEALEETQKQFGYDYNAQIWVVRNADGSVDGELRMVIPVYDSTREIIKRLSETAIIPSRTWFAVGAAYEPKQLGKKARERYRLFMGLLDVVMQYAPPMYRGNYFAAALMAVDDMAVVHDVQAKAVIFRLNWNSGDFRPDAVDLVE